MSQNKNNKKNIRKTALMKMMEKRERSECFWNHEKQISKSSWKEGDEKVWQRRTPKRIECRVASLLVLFCIFFVFFFLLLLFLLLSLWLFICTATASMMTNWINKCETLKQQSILERNERCKGKTKRKNKQLAVWWIVLLLLLML